jgi:hypothetical protein
VQTSKNFLFLFAQLFLCVEALADGYGVVGVVDGRNARVEIKKVAQMTTIIS